MNGPDYCRHAIIKALISPGGEWKRKKTNTPQNFALYPLKACLEIMRHYSPQYVDVAVVSAVEDFWLATEVHSEPQQAAVEEKKDRRLERVRDETENRQQESINQERPGVIIKRELVPISHDQFTTVMRGHKIIIDLTQTDETEESGEFKAQLADNFLTTPPPASVDIPLKRMYRLADDNISVIFQVAVYTIWGLAE